MMEGAFSVDVDKRIVNKLISLIESGNYDAARNGVVSKLGLLPNPYFRGESSFSKEEMELSERVVWMFTDDPANRADDHFDTLTAIFDAAWEMDTNESMLAYAIKGLSVDYCSIFSEKLTKKKNNAIRERAIEQLDSNEDVLHSVEETMSYYLHTEQPARAFALTKKLQSVSLHDALLAESYFLREGVGVARNIDLALTREVEAMQAFCDSGRKRDYDDLYTLLNATDENTLMVFCNESKSVALSPERFTWYLTNIESFEDIEATISQIKSLCRLELPIN